MPASPNFRIHSCWSKAGLGTSIIIEFSPHRSNGQSGKTNDTKPGPRIALDLGSTPICEDSIQAGTVLLTHSHIDHVGAIFSHARAYSMVHGGAAATYYAPAEVIPFLERACQAMSALDNAVLDDASVNDTTIRAIRKSKPLQMNFVGVRPGDDIDLSHLRRTNGIRVFVRVVRVFHAGCPAVGYVIGTQHASTLKPEFRGVPKDEIRAALAQGIAIKMESVNMLEVAYTGDTSVDTFIRRKEEGVEMRDSSDSLSGKNAVHMQELLQCPLVLVESTFLMKDEEELARRRGHMHLQDVVSEVLATSSTATDSSDQPSEQQYVLTHVSARYDAGQILEQMAVVIPRRLWCRCHVAISSHVKPSHRWKHLVRPNGCISLSQFMKWSQDGD